MKVYIVSPSHDYVSMFESLGWEVVQDIKDCDVVQFTGGADVSPELYGHSKHPSTYSDCIRDKYESDGYLIAKGLGKPCLGICRGGQFLNVMNGGTMWQDVDGHAIGEMHWASHVPTGDKVLVTSTHHQMMNPHKDGEVLAIAHESSFRVAGVNDVNTSSDFEDVEVVWYPKTKDLCFQPHPEFMGADDCRRYYFELIDNLIGG